MDLTIKQKEAVETRNIELLVSAGAGAGKTSVLVKRIIEIVCDKDNPTDIDKVLVVTFTKAAAAHMKNKIREVLNNELMKNPDDEFIQRQILLINNAHISTIDSLCSYIVKNYYYLLEDVSPNYRIAEEAEQEVLINEVFNSIMNQKYEEANSEFLYFSEYFATGKNDIRLLDTVKRLYKYAQSHEKPDMWLDMCKISYSSGFDDIKDDAIKYYKSVLTDCKEIINKAIDICSLPTGPYMHLQALKDDRDIIDNIEKIDIMTSIYTALNSIKYTTLSKKKDEAVDKKLRDQVSEYRKILKKSLSDLAELFKNTDEASLNQDKEICSRAVNELISITKLFSNELLREKKSKGLFDYSDIEHMALEIVNRDDDKSFARDQLSAYFHEVLIDEYQDSNILQEKLLYSIGNRKNLPAKVFMVGDIKQSIYRFRMASPELFISKLDLFQENGMSQRKIFLKDNFRSRKQVVEAVNFIFKGLIKKSVGGVEYDSTQAMYYSAGYEPLCADEYLPELINITKTTDIHTAYEMEAMAIALKITSMVNADNPLYIKDENSDKRRILQYKDIVILLRSGGEMNAALISVLNKNNIPVISSSSVDFYETYEILTIMNFLKIIDNPDQDIPLTSVLISVLAGFSASEISSIRLINRNKSMYDALLIYKQENNNGISKKIEAFLELLEKFRVMAMYMPVHRLLYEIYDLTGFDAYVGGMSNGQVRLNNLHKLCNKAQIYENSSYKGLGFFLELINKIINYDLPMEDKATDETNAVRIMTIHKSKGLEFPVCILAGTNKRFNRKDSREMILLHQNKGIGIDKIDINRRIKSGTFMKKLISHNINKDSIAEEIRILYVALTRAKEKLIIVSCHGEKSQIGINSHISNSEILAAACQWDWIRKIITSDTKYFKITDYSEQLLNESLDTVINKTIVNNQSDSDDVDLNTISKRIHRQYSGTGEKRFSKVSVSKIKEEAINELLKEEQGNSQFTPHENEFPLIPEFIQRKESVSPSKRGQIYHTILEKWDYKQESTPESVNAMIKIMLSKKMIDDREEQIIDIKKILAFLNSPIGQRMKRADIKGLLKREQIFTVLFNGMKAGITSEDKDMLLQGIVDAYFEEDGDIVIVDYKTDYISKEHPEELSDKYKAQLISYKYALEKLTGKIVKEMILYSLHLNIELKVK